MVEYGSTPYMMFMLAEYMAIMLMCSMTVILFMGGWAAPLEIVPFYLVARRCLVYPQSVRRVFFMFSIVKAFVPRYRYDQLMRLGWKVFLPISIVMIFIVAFTLQLTGWGWHGGDRLMKRTLQFLNSLLLKEFVSAFLLSMRYFFAPKATINYPFEKGPVSPRFRGRGESMPCAAIPMGKSAALPANYVKPFAPPKPSPLKRGHARMTAHGAPCAMTLIWLNASIAAFARKHARVDAIVEGPNFEFATETREELYFDKDKLLANGDRWEREIARNISTDSPYR